MEASTISSRSTRGRFAAILLLAGSLVSCGGGVYVPAEGPPPPAEGAGYDDGGGSADYAESDRCYDRCASDYDGCSGGCHDQQMAQSFGNFGDTGAISAAGDQAQMCLQSCGQSQDSCMQGCESMARAEEEQQRLRDEAAAAAAAQPPPSTDQAPNAMAMTEAAPSGSCNACPSSCSILQASCSGGMEVSCYQAAACLCQCHMVNGGCGTDTSFLMQCIVDNQANAARLMGSAGAIAPGMPPPPAPAPAGAPAGSGGCPPGQQMVCGKCGVGSPVPGGACAAW